MTVFVVLFRDQPIGVGKTRQAAESIIYLHRQGEDNSLFSYHISEHVVEE